MTLHFVLDRILQHNSGRAWYALCGLRFVAILLIQLPEDWNYVYVPPYPTEVTHFDNVEGSW